MDREQQSQSGNCLLSSRQLLHVAEAFHRRHGVILDTPKVGFLNTKL
jgi:hypothetical protein